MGIVLFVMGAVVAVLVSMLVGGLMLPARQTVARAVRLRASPEAAWSLVADPAGYPAWRDTITSVEIEGTAPLRWREYGDDGALAFEAVTVEAPRRFTARAIDEDVARRPEREFRLVADEAGTRVEYVERTTTNNPVTRFVFRYVVRPHGAMDRTLLALATALGERAPGTVDVAQS